MEFIFFPVLLHSATKITLGHISNGIGGEKLICIPAEVEIDDKSLIAQMQKVTYAQTKLENELSELRRLIFSTKVREKGDSKESPRI